MDLQKSVGPVGTPGKQKSRKLGEGEEEEAMRLVSCASGLCGRQVPVSVPGPLTGQEMGTGAGTHTHICLEGPRPRMIQSKSEQLCEQLSCLHPCPCFLGLQGSV